MAESITIKSPHEIEIMRQAAKIAAGARSMGRQAVKDGLTTREIDRAVHEYIVKNGARPSCLGYEGFPSATCVSVNDEVIHGIPGKRIVRSGDIVSLDLCATYKGFVGDCAGTYGVGEISGEARRLIEVTRQAFFEGIRFAKSARRYRTTWKATAFPWCATSWATASAAACTRRRRSPTTDRRGAAPTRAWSRA